MGLFDKAATWRFAHEIGGRRFLELVRDETHTCYEGDHEHCHAWGYGCGHCPACDLRARGYETYQGGLAEALV